MKGFRERAVAKKHSSRSSTDSPTRISASSSSDSETGEIKLSKASLWSGFLSAAFSIFEAHGESSPSSEKQANNDGRSSGWTSAVKRAVSSGSMRRLQERVLGPSKTGISNSNSDIWLLGLCYKVSPRESFTVAADKTGLDAFEIDFSSRILITYRKGFNAIADSKYMSDAGWGCMLRSSQMLVAQALLFHQLGRSWRKSLDKPLDQEYVEILHLFGDSETSSFSIHNLLQAGKSYGLAPGSWVGPYAMCRSWETLAHTNREDSNPGGQLLPMAVYIVSGDEDGERGGAPVVCIEDASRHCLEFSKGQLDWTPILLLVPLVLGLEKVNPRYIPSLVSTFTFPQSLGIVGGKPGVSTYIVGTQDDKAFYLDPHDVQPVVHIEKGNLHADTSSYHSNIIRHIPLDSIDPSLAIGFYCRNKGDFDDFCFRASKLADESNGAPLFTVIHAHNRSPKTVGHETGANSLGRTDDSFDMVPVGETEVGANEDDWQLL